MTNQNSIIEVKKLSVYYGNGNKNKQVLFDVDFNVNKGEILGLIGESGAGKIND